MSTATLGVLALSGLLAPFTHAPVHAQSPSETAAPFAGPGRLLGTPTLRHAGELLCAERIDDRIVTVTQGGEVGFWSAVDGEALGGLRVGDVLTGWTVTADGRILVTLRGGGVVSIDPAGGGKFERVLEAEGSLVASSPSGQGWLALLSNLSPVRIWGSGEGAALEWDLGRQVFSSATFDEAGRLLVVAMDRDRMFKRGHAMDRPVSQLFVLDPAAGSGEFVGHLLFEDSRCDAFLLLPDGAAVAADDGGRLIRLDRETGEVLHERQIGLSPVVGLRYSPETDTLWSLDRENRALRLDPLTFEERGGLDLTGTPVRAWSLLESGTQHLISRNNRAELRDAETGEPLILAAGHVAPAVCLDFDPAGQRLVSSSYDGTAIVWDLASRLPLRVVRSHEGFVYAARFSPSGETLATAGKDGTVQLHRGTGESPGTLRFHRAAVTDLAWGQSDDVLASVGGDAQVIGWDLEGLAERWIQEVPSGVLFRAGCAGSDLLIGEATVSNFAVEGGARLSEAARYDAIVTSIAGHPRAAALGLANGWVQMLERTEGSLRPSGRLGPHLGRVEAAAIDPSGTLVAAGAGPNVTLWELGGERLGQLGPLDGPVMSIAFSADGRSLAVGTQTGSILTWTRAD